MKRYLMWVSGIAVTVAPSLLVGWLWPAVIAGTYFWPGILGAIIIARHEGWL